MISGEGGGSSIFICRQARRHALGLESRNLIAGAAQRAKAVCILDLLCC